MPINLLLNPKEVAYILKDAAVKALVYFEAFAEAVNAIKSQVPTLTLQVCENGCGQILGRIQCRLGDRPGGRQQIGKRDVLQRVLGPDAIPPVRRGARRARC